ncbi:MAG TPA: DUF2652 domain-containing protein [Myxococcota bacterium]
MERAILLIADIGGYTRFMTYHRMNLAHAQDAIARLLEAVIDGAGGMKLAKLEGDAAFFFGPVNDKAGAAIAAMRRHFLDQKDRLVGERACTCDSCMQIENLKLKFVVHEGELVRQRVKKNEEVAGVDVILVHRMLKNDVPISEYALASETALKHLSELGMATSIDHDLEGIGAVKTAYVDLTALPRNEPVTPPTGLRKFLAKLGFEMRAVPYMIGLKEPCKDFQSVPPPSER